MTPQKRPITPQERDAIQCLACVTYPCASWDKRFNREVLQPALTANQLSDKAAAQLWRLFIRYRRQFQHPNKATLLDYASRHSAPDFRKQQAEVEARARIEQLKTQLHEQNPSHRQG